MNSIFSKTKTILGIIFVTAYHAYRSWVWQCIVRMILLFLLSVKSSNGIFWQSCLVYTMIFHYANLLCKGKHWSISIIFSYITTIVLTTMFLGLERSNLYYHNIYDSHCYYVIYAQFFTPLYSILFIKALQIFAKPMHEQKLFYKVVTAIANIIAVLLLIYFILYT